MLQCHPLSKLTLISNNSLFSLLQLTLLQCSQESKMDLLTAVFMLIMDTMSLLRELKCSLSSKCSQKKKKNHQSERQKLQLDNLNQAQANRLQLLDLDQDLLDREWDHQVDHQRDLLFQLDQPCQLNLNLTQATNPLLDLQEV